jgi:hypothetical protein
MPAAAWPQGAEQKGADMAAYNGHRSWNAWNVALWIGNDEPLYRLAQECLKECRTVRMAARRFLAIVGAGSKTPDGATYNLTCVQEALAGLRD